MSTARVTRPITATEIAVISFLDKDILGKSRWWTPSRLVGALLVPWCVGAKIHHCICLLLLHAILPREDGVACVVSTARSVTVVPVDN